MKAITLWQPWATLLVSGKKHNETRSWKTNYRGEILIHAAKKPMIDGLAIMGNSARRYLREALGLPEVYRETDWTAYYKKLPIGVIIGKAELIDCILINSSDQELMRKTFPTEYAFGDYTVGRYAWIMDNPVLFERPIPANGKQGLWNWEGGEQE